MQDACGIRPASPQAPHSMAHQDRLPVAPLLATLLVQALAIMTSLAVPTLAPAIAADLGVSPARVGLFTSLLYVAATAGAILCPGFIARFGPIRMSQVLMLFCAAAMAIAATGTVAALAVAALVLGVAYALPIPSGALILVRVTPPRLHNLAFSIRQTGVPIGGMAVGALLPATALAFGWRAALLLLAIPVLALTVALAPLRPALDAERRPGARLIAGNPLRPVLLLFRSPDLRWLAVAAFFFAGTELAFAAFLVTYLNGAVGFDLIAAGLALSVFQVGGFSGRLALGAAADRVQRRRLLLGGVGLGMAAAAAVAGLFTASWPRPLVLAVALAAGFTSGGWTGVGIAEVARSSGPTDAVAATGALSMLMFLGVIAWPTLFSLLVDWSGGYTLPYAAVAAGATFAALLLLVSPGRAPDSLEVRS